MITQETRRESYEEVKKSIGYRHQLVLNALRDRPQSTARELALYLWEMGQIPSPERNYTHPRLTELVEEGKVRVVGKRKCPVTGRMVAVYELNDGKQEVEQGSLWGGEITWPGGE